MIVRPKLRSLLCLCFLCLLLLVWVFQPSSLKGGPIGDYIDKRLLRYNIRKEQKLRKDELLNSGVTLPELDIRNNRFKKILPEPFSLLSESLNKTLRNKRRVWEAEHFAEQWKQRDGQAISCQSILESQLRPPPIGNDEIGATRSGDRKWNIPNWILQPNEGEWFRPIKFGRNTTTNPTIETMIAFDDSDMMRLIRDQFPDLLALYDASPTVSSKVHLWTICALYWYGGFAFGSSIRDPDILLQEVANNVDNWYHCDDYAVIIFNGNKEARDPQMLMIASSPRNPHLLCLLQKLAKASHAHDFSDILSHLVPVDSSKAGKLPFPAFSEGWDVRTSSCSEALDDNCCAAVLVGSGITSTTKSSLVDKRKSHLFINGMFDATGEAETLMNKIPSFPRREVTISETKSGQGTAPTSAKKPIRDKLENRRCLPGWLCNRCLRTMLFGSFAACSRVCASCYEKFQCEEGMELTSTLATIEVALHQKRQNHHGEYQIPRIIHQTWVNDMDTLRFPELVRLQNSWRQQSGFEFRFYNDTEARDYVESNYPKRFLEAYDSFLPGAFKADFFRLLVLLKDGGIYADADVHLETNLNTFLTPNLSFFVPRETIRDLAGNDFCLWNGLLGASPGHPIIAKAIEHMLQLIATRADYFDVERKICSSSGNSASVWKLRSLPTLLLSGPCALGMAVNDALGKTDLLANFEPGWLSPLPGSVMSKSEIGDSLILLADKMDMGSFRFSDVERNLIVASTDMIGLSKKSVCDAPLQNKIRSRHYSETEFLSDVYGTYGVYSDNHVTEETLTLDIRFFDH